MASSNPHIRSAYSPLRTLIFSVLRRFGDFSPESVSGEAASMMIEFANEVVDEWNFHPTLDGLGGEPVAPYTSVDEAREIPDQVVRAGLLAHYAAQQMSEKSQMYQGLYYMTLNREAHRIYAGGNPTINMQVVR